MQLIQTVEACRAWVQDQKNQGKCVGFVPTMGNLHAGHLSLIEHLEPHCDAIIVSIFVNPTQFSPDEDFEQYPRTLENDLEKLSAINCQTVFHPTASELYGAANQAHAVVQVPGLDMLHCAKSRPHFFTGVATVVTKLLNIVQPHCVMFGKKDFQQLRIIEALIKSLHIPVIVLSAPIVRESNGLAMSSRNRYLNTEQKNQAAQLYAILRATAIKILQPGISLPDMEINAVRQLTEAGFTVDYFNIADPNTLNLIDNPQPNMSLLTAASLNQTRLIDNLQIANGRIV